MNCANAQTAAPILPVQVYVVTIALVIALYNVVKPYSDPMIGNLRCE